MNRTLQLGVFGSGRGSNFRAIHEAIQSGTVPNTRITLVVSNNSKAGILEYARAQGIPSVHMSEGQFGNASLFAARLIGLLRDHAVNLVVLAGYMKLLPAQLVAAYRNRIINIHPALLPKFGGKGMYGMRVHEAVIRAGEKVSGATVHLVDEEYDRGAILLQREVPVHPGDTPEALAARVLHVEHELYPEVLRMIAGGAISLPGETTDTRP